MRDIRDRLYAVVMAGGPGKRFWPWSTADRPKPFLSLVGEESLLQACCRRLRTVLPPERIIVIVSAAHLELLADQVPDIPPENRIGEAQGRDSAACVGLGTALVQNRDPAGVLAALPADQIISPTSAFTDALLALGEATAAGSCVGTLGIEPAEPATRFGYIEVGESVGRYRDIEVCRVTRFKEKPASEEAVEYVSSGRYLWNAGIFVAPAEVMAREIRRHFEPLGSALDEIERLLRSGVDPREITSRVYKTVPKMSIDYAVIEKLTAVLTLRAPFEWDDVGDWRALRRHLELDVAGNVSVGCHVARDSVRTVVFARDAVVATLGLEDIVVVQAGKAILVARADKLDELKALVADVEARETSEEGAP